MSGVHTAMTNTKNTPIEALLSIPAVATDPGALTLRASLRHLPNPPLLANCPHSGSRSVAQLVEHRSPKPRAVGSSPSTPAKPA